MKQNIKWVALAAVIAVALLAVPILYKILVLPSAVESLALVTI